MRLALFAATSSLVLLGGVAAAAGPMSKGAALKLMHDRHEKMEKIGKAFKTAGRELKGGSPNLAVIRSSSRVIAGYAPKVPAWFPRGTGPDVGKTMAKPEIWQNPQDFRAKSQAFAAAARAFNAAARSGDMARVNARLSDVGKTCKACHDLYRTEHKD